MYRDPDPRFESLGGHPVALRPLRVGMIGIGTVGAGTFRVLARNQAEIAARAGRGIEVVVVSPSSRRCAKGSRPTASAGWRASSTAPPTSS